MCTLVTTTGEGGRGGPPPIARSLEDRILVQQCHFLLISSTCAPSDPCVTSKTLLRRCALRALELLTPACEEEAFRSACVRRRLLRPCIRAHVAP